MERWCQASDALVDALKFLYDPRTPEWIRDTRVGPDGASEQERRAQPVLERLPSEALDTGQLALYLCFREIPKWAVTDVGIHVYFQQYEAPDPETRNTVFAQLEQEASCRDMAGVLDLFRFLLEDDFRERFYEELYTLVARHVRSLANPVALTDLLSTSVPTARDAGNRWS
eukprot:s2799_g9.t1